MSASDPNKPIWIGLLKVQPKAVLKHLRNDLRDDWFPDPLGHEDCLDVEFLRSRIAALQAGATGEYAPVNRRVRDVPKKGGTLRYSLESCLVDRFIYQALVEELADPLDECLSSRVFSHRVERSKSRSRRYFFLPAIEQWALFEEAVRDSARDRWVVETDLQNFYESIVLQKLEETLYEGLHSSGLGRRKLARKRYATGLLMRLLPSWAYAQTHGLPQNRDASSFLANQYLRGVDAAILSEQAEYYRYMDDIRIVCKDKHECRKALLRLTIALRKVGLSLNAMKTLIHEPGTKSHNELLSKGDSRLKRIDEMWRSRSADVIARSVKYVSALARELVEGDEADSKAFRFCVGRLEKLMRCEDFEPTIPEAQSLKKLAISRLVEDAHACDSLCRFLQALSLEEADLRRVEDLLLAEDVYLYEWQRYHMVLLLLSHGYSGRRLLAAAERCCFDSGEARHSLDMLIPLDLAMVLLGRHGGSALRKRIGMDFERLTKKGSFHPGLQRAALIAVHELSYESDLRLNVAPHILEPLRSSLQRTVSHCRGRYFIGAKKLPASELFDAVSAYV